MRSGFGFLQHLIDSDSIITSSKWNDPTPQNISFPVYSYQKRICSHLLLGASPKRYSFEREPKSEFISRSYEKRNLRKRWWSIFDKGHVRQSPFHLWLPLLSLSGQTFGQWKCSGIRDHFLRRSDCYSSQSCPIWLANSPQFISTRMGTCHVSLF